MGVNANLVMLLRPSGSTIWVVVGLVLLLFAWLRTAPEYTPFGTVEAPQTESLASDGAGGPLTPVEP